MIKLVVSAYQQNSTPHDNTMRFASLINRAVLCGFKVEACTGTYQGEREYSISITDFEHVAQYEIMPTEPIDLAIDVGHDLMAVFGQHAALLLDNDNVSVLVRNGETRHLGKADYTKRYVVPADCTEFLNGVTLTVRPALATQS